MYRTEARLVITSRLHCALPCTAMGIPVIVGRDMNEHRFAGMDKLLNYYNEDEFDQIDFNPQPVDIEWLKEKVLALAEKMIKSTYDKYSLLCEVSQFYETRKEKNYYSGIKAGYLTLKQQREFLECQAFEKEILSYISGRKIEELNLYIYGAGDKGKWMLVRYREKLKKFKSVTIVDKNKIGQDFYGYIIQSPEVLLTCDPQEIMVIVAANAYYSGVGKEIGNELLYKYHLHDGKEFFFLDKLNNSMNMPLDACGTVESWADGF